MAWKKAEPQLQPLQPPVACYFVMRKVVIADTPGLKTLITITFHHHSSLLYLDGHIRILLPVWEQLIQGTRV